MMVAKKNIPTLSPNEALSLICTETFQLSTESVSLWDADGRFLAEDIVSEMDIPPFDNSAMDGFATKSEYLRFASKENPVSLPILHEIKAGDQRCELTANSAVRIMTGAMIPHGADVVIPVEETSETNGKVFFYSPANKGDNIRLAGEDVAKGMKVLQKGERLNAAAIGLLASLNRTTVQVFRKARVAIIATGDELVEPGQYLPEGHIRNSNAYSLYAEVSKYGGVPLYLGIARDCKEETAAIIEKAITCDIIITTGGVSMGQYDFVPEVLRDLGMRIVFETVKMKPGKPCIFGVLEKKSGKKLFFGLPGNPVSSLLSFIQFVRPAILLLMGARKIRKPEMCAILKEKITKKRGRTHFLRGIFTIEHGRLFVKTTGPQGSGILRSMHESNCLIILPPEKEVVESGEEVIIQLIHHEEIA
ncbi:MAG: molybdopterin molybdotransferase MoeA [Spirochaetes bacterium]|nr:molybdopterin molybdotransferase MoeA [Spirochaetota bacterium]